jgi:hypothetical protein
LWLPKADTQGLLHIYLWKHLKLTQRILSRKEIFLKKDFQLLFQIEKLPGKNDIAQFQL